MVEHTKKKSCLGCLRKYFKEYCNNTSIHGFKYFGENRSYFERCWWGIVFALTLTCCFFAISLVYQKWIRSPVIVTFATTETPIFSIPFPAVTICPEVKSIQKMYSQKKIINAFMKKQPLTETQKLLLEYMSLICDKSSIIGYSNNTYVKEDIHDILYRVNPMFPFQQCYFMGQNLNCKDIFTPVFTDEGICYSFNMANPSEIFRDNVYQYDKFPTVKNKIGKEWTIEEGYSKSAGVETYPRRALQSGYTNSLRVFLTTTYLDMDETCRRGINGYKVSLHIPTRIPRPSQEYFRVPENEIVIAAIQPNMIRTSSRLKGYDVQKRKCYFSYEKQLFYYKIYTAKNCKMECLANYTLYYCGCVGYFMPRENSTKICGYGSIKCMEYAEKKLHLSNVGEHLNVFQNHSNTTWPNKGKYFTGKLQSCGCLPMCSDLSYPVETSQASWDWYKTMQAIYNNNVPFTKEMMKMSELTIFFKSSEFIFSERNELYGPLEFLANFGGLLGLFTGFSVLSIMEAFYFLTIRLFCNLKLYGNLSGQVKEHN